jgi:UDP-2,3-diacylglucosamine hydrolase
VPRLTLVSDLHLHPGNDPVQERFTSLLQLLAERHTGGEEQQLLVAGDLFSFWVDRPLVARLFESTLAALRSLVAGGCRVSLLEGNRDFGFGPVLARSSGADLPGERLVLERGGARVLVLHGDQLLTADRRYQTFKWLVRSWPARLTARLAPSFLLLWAVRRLERVSAREKSRKPAAVMRVDEDAAVREMTSAGAETMVHGHTHDPGERAREVSGRRLRMFNLGEWDSGGGTILDWPEDGEPRLIHWPEND